jgi:hypothetical protein
MNQMLLFVAVLTAPGAGPKAPPLSADAKQIKAAHVKLLAAINAKQPEVVKSLFTKNFTQTASKSTFDRDAAVALMTQGAASTKVEWTLSGLTVKGERAAYDSNFKYETSVADNSGKRGVKSKAHKMIGSGVQKLQLVKEGGRWLYTHLEVLSSAMTLDGQPFNGQAKPGPIRK